MWIGDILVSIDPCACNQPEHIAHIYTCIYFFRLKNKPGLPHMPAFNVKLEIAVVLATIIIIAVSIYILFDTSQRGCQSFLFSDDPSLQGLLKHSKHLFNSYLSFPLGMAKLGTLPLMAIGPFIWLGVGLVYLHGSLGLKLQAWKCKRKASKLVVSDWYLSHIGRSSWPVIGE